MKQNILAWTSGRKVYVQSLIDVGGQILGVEQISTRWIPHIPIGLNNVPESWWEKACSNDPKTFQPDQHFGRVRRRHFHVAVKCTVRWVSATRWKWTLRWFNCGVTSGVSTSVNRFSRPTTNRCCRHFPRIPSTPHGPV